MIGNDLVYLPTWPQREGGRLQRFRAKVFTEAEQKLITLSENPHLAEAWFWSCKEAAYKVWFKKSHRREFAPKRFEVSSSKLSVECLKLGLESSLFAFERKYFTLSSVVGNYIHTMASDQSFAELREAESWRGHFRPESLMDGKLIIEKDDRGIPFGRLPDGEVDLSVSHAGKEVAVTWLI